MQIAVERKKGYIFALLFVIGLIIYFLPIPSGVDPKGWQLFAIFTATIVGIVLKPFPMGVMATLALCLTLITGTLTFSEAFSGFSNDIVWLVVFAFFVSRGFISTGLGDRVGYQVMYWLGKNSLGLGYGLVATDLILAPTIPSVTARAGGIVYPILRSLADVFTGTSHDPRMGAFLTLAAFQGSGITSAMFLTSMAGNPLTVELAREHGVTISWGLWAIAAFIPGIISLIAVPYILYRFVSPVIKQTPHAREMALEKLRQLGPMKKEEWIVLSVFILMITLWIVGPYYNIKATIGAMIGLVIMLITGVLKWKDILEEGGAWDTFIWFATLVTLASFLNHFGLSTWFSKYISSHVAGLPWMVGFVFISIVYFFSHYFFASNVAHIGTMYAPLLVVSIALGTPPELAVLALAFISSLFGGLTHYGSGPAPIFFGSGYVSVGQWWRMGALIGCVNIFIWLVLGGLWWKVLGLW